MSTEKQQTNYINTPVYANQISTKRTNEKGNSYYFGRLNLPETKKSKTIQEKYGNVKSFSILLPDFAVKGAIVEKKADKVYSIEKDSQGKSVNFNPLVLNENKEKIGGKHILASISMKMPESKVELEDKSKVKVIMSILTDEVTKTYENKTMTVSYKNMAELFKENTVAVTNSLKAHKDKLKDIFNEVELAKTTTDLELDDFLEPELEKKHIR